MDIFAKSGTPVHASTKGMVLYTGNLAMGGKVVIVLGPKWRFHYYAHLDTITTYIFDYVSPHKAIGTVGNSGNAAGKPPHLHYSMITAIPYPWRADRSHQGWKKMFFLNPITYLNR